MAKKQTFDESRIQNLLNILTSGGNLGKDGLAYLRKYYENNDEFHQWYDTNFGGMAKNSSGATVRLSDGKVQDAKDSYQWFNFSPLQSSKKAGPGTNEMILRSGKRTNQTSGHNDAKVYVNGNGELAGAQVVGGAMKTAGQTRSIIQRGLAGAKLNQEDQRIFDRWKTAQQEIADDEEAARQMKAQQRAADERSAAERAAKFKQLGMKDNRTLNDAQIQELLERRAAKIKSDQEYADWERKQQYQDKQKAIEAQAKAQAEADKAALKRKQEETDNGRTPDMTDEDYAKWMQMGGVKAARWGYSAEDEAEIENARQKIQDALNSGQINGFVAVNARRLLDEQIANGRWKKQVSKIPTNELTTEQAFAQTHVDPETGVRYGLDGNGKIYELYNPNKNGANRQEWRDKWIDSRTERYEKEEDEDGKRKYTYDQALDMAKNDAARRFKDEEDIGVDPNLFEGGNADVCSLCGSPLDGEGVCTNPDCDHYKAYYGDQPVAVEEPGVIEPQAQGHVKASYL